MSRDLLAVPGQVETDLAAGAMTCGGALRPWGHARPRRIRDLTATLQLRPRDTHRYGDRLRRCTPR